MLPNRICARALGELKQAEERFKEDAALGKATREILARAAADLKAHKDEQKAIDEAARERKSKAPHL